MVAVPSGFGQRVALDPSSYSNNSHPVSWSNFTSTGRRSRTFAGTSPGMPPPGTPSPGTIPSPGIPLAGPIAGSSHSVTSPSTPMWVLVMVPSGFGHLMPSDPSSKTITSQPVSSSNRTSVGCRSRSSSGTLSGIPFPGTPSSGIIPSSGPMPPRMSTGWRRCIMGGGSSSHSRTSPDSSVKVLVKVPSSFRQRVLVVPSSKMTSSQPVSGSNITIAGILSRISSGRSAPPGINSSLKSPGPMPSSKLPKRAASRALIGSSGDPRGAIIGSTNPVSSHSWTSPSVPVNVLVNEPSAFRQRVPVEPSSNVTDSQPVASSNSNDVGCRSRISSGMSSGNCSPGPPIPRPSSGEVMPENRSAGSGVRPGPHLWTPPRPSTHSPLPSGQS